MVYIIVYGVIASLRCFDPVVLGYWKYSKFLLDFAVGVGIELNFTAISFITVRCSYSGMFIDSRDIASIFRAVCVGIAIIVQEGPNFCFIGN